MIDIKYNGILQLVYNVSTFYNLNVDILSFIDSNRFIRIIFCRIINIYMLFILQKLKIGVRFSRV